jgi:Pentapeptide repeats (8 copies)
MAEASKPQPKPPARWETQNKARRYPLWVRPFVWAEWCMEWAAYCLSEFALFTVLEYLGKLSIVVAVIFYFLEAPTRRKQAQYDAWRVITSNEAKPGNGGRIQALQDLNDSGIDLSGVDLQKAFLGGVKLSTATLREARLSGTNLREGDLSGADLRDADLTGATLIGADLSDADLTGAKLANAQLTGARLIGTKLERADLRDADLRGAFAFRKREFDFYVTDLSKATVLTQEQIDSAKGDSQTILPKGFVRPNAWVTTTPPTK